MSFCAVLLKTWRYKLRALRTSQLGKQLQGQHGEAVIFIFYSK